MVDRRNNINSPRTLQNNRILFENKYKEEYRLIVKKLEVRS